MLNVRIKNECKNVSIMKEMFPVSILKLMMSWLLGMLIFLFWCVNNYMHLKLNNKWSKLFGHNSCYLQFCLENKHEPADSCQIELLLNG